VKKVCTPKSIYVEPPESIAHDAYTDCFMTGGTLIVLRWEICYLLWLWEMLYDGLYDGRYAMHISTDAE